jgi:hypothetical protein
MSRRLSRTARFSFAALVGAGLTFGAGSVLAAPSAAAACPYNPSIGHYGFTCSTVADCNIECPRSSGNICTLAGCCRCAL